MINYRRQCDLLKDQVIDKNWEISVLKSEKEKFQQMNNDTEHSLTKIQTDFETLFTD